MRKLFPLLLGLTVSGLAGAIPAASPSVRPALFFSPQELPEIRARAESTAWLRALRGSLLATADRFLATPTDPYSLTSSENGIGTAGRALQQRIGVLAFAGYLTNDERYFQKAKALLLAAARQTEPTNRTHWVTHLQYSDAAQAFAIGYDWLQPFLSEAERTEVRAEIAQFGDLLFTDETVWGTSDPGVTSSNHNSVHFGSLGLCALALGDRPEWLARATERVRAYFRHFIDETGYATEGHQYLAYGLLGALPFAHALERAGGPDLVAERPAFARTSDQVLWSLLPTGGRMLPMNDNRDEPCSSVVAYAMLRFGQPVHLWAWLQSVGETGSGLHGVGKMVDGLTAPFPFLWADKPLEPVAPAEASWPLGHRFASGRVFLRSAWDSPEAAHVSFTSGYDHHRGHNHQDENAVTLHALGEAFLIDPGYEPADSRSHNTLTIGGADQIPGSSGRVVAYREDANGAFVRGQAPEAYDWQKALVGHFDRKVYFVRGPQPYLVWRDDTQLETDRPGEVTAHLITAPDNRFEPIEGGYVIHGARTGARCLVQVMSPISAVALAVENLDGKTFVSRGRTYSYDRYYRSAIATARALNPRLLTVAFPFRDQAELPAIRLTADDGDNLVCTLTFPDGRIDRLTFGPEHASLERISPGSKR